MGCLAGFNRSVWNALWVLSPIAFAGILYISTFATVRRKYYFFFDPKHNTDRGLKDENVDFTFHGGRYFDIAKLVIALSSGAVAFLVNTWSALKPPLTPSAKNLADVTPIVVGFFGAAAALCITFMILQTTWYEQYCHAPAHNSYRAWKYAVCNVCAYTGFISFLLGFGWLAANLFAH